jgi:DnaJ-class molecular chaperone
MSAEKCPVCCGAGTLALAPTPGTTSASGLQTCHGCGGKGWVETWSPYPWTIYRDPCDGCPHKKPYQITWGNY